MAAKYSFGDPWIRSRRNSWVKTNPILAYLVCFAFFVVVSAERKYKLHFEKFVVVSYDISFANFSGMAMAKYNRSSTVLSGTFDFTTDPRPDLLLSIDGYEKIGTQYMLSAIQVKEEPLCIIFEKFGKIIISPDDTETTNLKMKCPILKGSYFMHNYRPEEKNMPEDVPGNEWRFDVKARYPEMSNSLLLHLQVFLKEASSGRTGDNLQFGLKTEENTFVTTTLTHTVEPENWIQFFNSLWKPSLQLDHYC